MSRKETCGLGHRYGFEQYALLCPRAVQQNHDGTAAVRHLSEHYPTVTMQELPRSDGWINGLQRLTAGPLEATRPVFRVLFESLRNKSHDHRPDHDF